MELTSVRQSTHQMTVNPTHTQLSVNSNTKFKSEERYGHTHTSNSKTRTCGCPSNTFIYTPKSKYESQDNLCKTRGAASVFGSVLSETRGERTEQKFAAYQKLWKKLLDSGNFASSLCIK